MIRVVSVLNSIAKACFLLSLLSAIFSLDHSEVLAKFGVMALVATPVLRVIVLTPKFRSAWVLLMLWVVTATFWLLQ